MAFELPPLPFAKNALEPVMKSETFDYHYEKHHKAYVTKLNQLLDGKPEASKSLVDVIKSSTGGVFNNAAQVWNHTFFWDSLKPAGGGAPPPPGFKLSQKKVWFQTCAALLNTPPVLLLITSTRLFEASGLPSRSWLSFVT